MGSIHASIEILDSDDEADLPDIIDLTGEDGLDQHPPPLSLQPAATYNTNFLISSAPYFQSGLLQPLDSDQHSFSHEGLETRPITKKAENTSTSITINYLPLQTSESEIYQSVEVDQSIIREDNSDSEDSDIMERPRRFRPKHAHDLSTPRPSKELLAMEDILQGVRKNMEQDHAFYVNSELLVALERSNELQECLPDFTDDVDPFAYLPSLGSNMNENTESEEPSDVLKDSFEIPERVPRYKHYITITRSFLVPDNRTLYFQPYLCSDVDITEQQKHTWLKALKEYYDEPEDPQASRQREYVDRLRGYLPTMLKKSGLNREAVVSYAIDMECAVPAKAFAASTNPVALFSTAFENTFAAEMKDVISEIYEHFDVLQNSKNVLVEDEEPDLVKQLLHTHLKSCPVCHVYACGSHGVYESASDEEEDEDEDIAGKADKTSSNGKTDKMDKGYADLNMTYESLRHWSNEGSARSEPADTSISIYKDGRPCSPKCFMIEDVVRDKCSQWTNDEGTYFQALFLGMQNEPRVSCLLAPLMERSCYDVHKMAVFLTAEIVRSPQQKSKNKGKLDWYDNKGKKILVENCRKYTNTHLHDKRCQPTGCDHPGISCYQAGNDCICFGENVLCDKFCSCADDCYMKFTGCNCPPSENACSEDCLCQLLNRECDPDLCHTCGAAETLDPFKPHEDRPLTRCCNTDIQRGIRKHLVIGESTHSDNIGYGAFTAEPIKKGEFIAEYVGEIISTAEADRRAELYFVSKISFFFNLNNEVVIDSYRYGNLERFINHSKNNQNCEAIVKLVNGEHRIGFYALKNLKVGVELWFDYGEEFIKNQGLTEMPKIQGERRERRRDKGVVALPMVQIREFSEEVGDALSFANDAITEAGPVFQDNYEEDQYGDDIPVMGPARRSRRHVRKPRKYTR